MRIHFKREHNGETKEHQREQKPVCYKRTLIVGPSLLGKTYNK